MDSYYEGEWDNNLRQGTGKMYYCCKGETYEGQWLKNLRHGAGKLTSKDNSYITGTWENDKLKMKDVTHVDKDGNTYRGEVCTLPSGKVEKSGKGKICYQDGTTYEGGFKNGEKHGKGFVVDPEGQRIQGSWNQGIKLSAEASKILEEKEKDEEEKAMKELLK